MKNGLQRLIFISLRYSIGIGIIIYLYNAKQIDFNTLHKIDFKLSLIAIILCVIQLLLSALRVKMLLASQQIHVSFWRCNIYNAVGIFYSILLPGAMSGDALRAYYFWRCNDTKHTTKASLIAALVSDRLIGVLSLLLLGLISATLSAKAIGISLLSIAAIWLLFIGSIWVYLVICRCHQYSWKIFGTRFAFIVDIGRHFLARLDLRVYSSFVLWSAFIYSVLIQISSVVIVFIFAKELGAGLGFGQIMAVSSIGFIVNSLPVSPGGLGVGEGCFEFLFSVVGGRYGSNVFFISRVFLFLPAILGAFFAVQLFKFSKKVPDFQQQVA